MLGKGIGDGGVGLRRERRKGSDQGGGLQDIRNLKGGALGAGRGEVGIRTQHCSAPL